MVTAPAHALDAHRAHFEALFRADADPWGYDHAWTEEAKRRAVGAALRGGRVGRLLELGCGNGASTASLARCCHHLDAIDGSASAVALTRRRLSARGRCRIWQASMPEALPPGPYDAIVATEVLYYLPRGALAETLGRVRDSLTPHGQLVVTASVRPFGDRDIGNAELFTALRRTFGPAVRERAGGPWRLVVHRSGRP